MSENKLDALFREIVSRDAAEQSRILVSERPENQEVPALSRRRLEKMLDRELGESGDRPKAKKAHPALSRTARILGRVLVAAAACIVILFGLVMTSEAVRDRVLQFLIKITPKYTEVRLDDPDHPTVIESRYVLAYDSRVFDLKAVSESYASGTEQRFRIGENGYLIFRASGDESLTGIDKANAKEIEAVRVGGNAGFLVARQDGSSSLLWSVGEMHFLLDGSFTGAELLQLAGYVKEERVPVSEEPLDPSTKTGTLRYEPAYVPEGFLETKRDYTFGTSLVYEKGEDEYFSVGVYGAAAVSQYDTENAKKLEMTTVRGEPALLIVAADDWATLCWSTESAQFAVMGTLPEAEIFKVAESLKEMQP